MAQQESKNQERSTTQGGQGGAATQRSIDVSGSQSKQGSSPSSNENGGNGGSDKSLMGQVRSTAADAYGTATTKAAEKLEEQKGSLTSGLTTVAESIRKFSKNIGEEGTDSGMAGTAATYGDTAADKIEQAAKYFERHDVEAIYHDVEELARQNPAIFIGGAFALGFLAARFLKSSSSRSLTGSGGVRNSRSLTDTSSYSGSQSNKKSGSQTGGAQGSGSSH